MSGKHHNFILQRIFNKHGIDVLCFEVVEKAHPDELMEREQFYIDSLEPFTNISDARGSHAHTEAAKAKMRGRKFSEEHKAKLREARLGQPSPRRGVRTGRVPVTAFRRGDKPWNAGSVGVMQAWNKGKHLGDTHRASLRKAKLSSMPDVIGRSFGEWVVLDIGESRSGNRTLRCKCSCGVERDVMFGRLKSGNSSSCGHSTRPPVLRGEDHPMFGRKHTPDALAKIKDARSKQDMSSRRRSVEHDKDQARRQG